MTVQSCARTCVSRVSAQHGEHTTAHGKEMLTCGEDEDNDPSPLEFQPGFRLPKDTMSGGAKPVRRKRNQERAGGKEHAQRG